MKKKPTEKEIVQLLKSGDFTIAYHDNGYACLYKGRMEYEDLPEGELYVFGDTHGYTPEVVMLLIRALGGSSQSI
jgi:hypothetical protein